MAHHLPGECEFERAAASNKRGVVSNQLVKPLAIENVQMVQSKIAERKLSGCRRYAAVQMDAVTQASGSRNPT